MKYTIDGYTFYSVREFEGAKRDALRIRALQRSGKTDTEVARNYRRQIKENKIKFETRLGKEFAADINKKLCTKSAGDRIAGRRLSIIGRLKNFFMVPLGIAMVGLVCVGVIFGSREWESRKNMAEVQAAANGKLTEKEQVMDESLILPRFKELAAKNPDLVGWLTIPDTIIDYPVMYRTGDNDYYLEHDFDGNSDNNGLLVLDKRCTLKGNDINSLVHGHNMNSGVMFGTLLNYTDKKYFEAHPTITFSTLYEEQTFEIIGVFRSQVYNENTKDFAFYNYIRIENKEQFDTYVRGIKSQSLYDTGVTAYYGDKLLTLSTCEYSKENGRLVVVGRCKQ